MTTTDDLEPVLTVSEVMEVLGCGRRTAYDLVASGALRSVRLGRAIRIPRSALREFLDGRAGER